MEEDEVAMLDDRGAIVGTGELGDDVAAVLDDDVCSKISRREARRRSDDGDSGVRTMAKNDLLPIPPSREEFDRPLDVTNDGWGGR